MPASRPGCHPGAYVRFFVTCSVGAYVSHCCVFLFLCSSRSLPFAFFVARHLGAYVSHGCFCFCVFIFARTFRIAPFLPYRTVLFALLFVFVLCSSWSVRFALLCFCGLCSSWSVRFALLCFWHLGAYVSHCCVFGFRDHLGACVSHCCVFVLVLPSSSVRLALLCFRLSAAAPGAAR